ncbi:hypothetical protein NQ318_011978 [Aromia moschata]|uniref:Uncharacterized protein n=1 Tax=Aromia moschata TaxID=1265417 RepID=A0AAV8XZ59_9CUCU|nr:hypothetical protein NQ318_011978 [Aromia moschata]
MASLIRRIISTTKAPKPVKGAPYNQAVVFNNMVFLSGVLGMDKDTMKLVEGGAPAEARQALKKYRAYFRSIGCFIRKRH